MPTVQATITGTITINTTPITVGAVVPAPDGTGGVVFTYPAPGTPPTSPPIAPSSVANTPTPAPGVILSLTDLLTWAQAQLGVTSPTAAELPAGLPTSIALKQVTISTAGSFDVVGQLGSSNTDGQWSSSFRPSTAVPLTLSDVQFQVRTA